MKRSEMLRIIGNQLNGNSQNPEHQNDVETMLNLIEKHGMLPPTIRYDAIDEYEDIQRTDILHDNDVSFSWEPED